eukprot:NODE_647_length_5572_cov_0.361593.p2 type:complete len:223 gc:universal NODE_647_length_5572_cov_0.361593:1376-708(-)
MWIVSHQKRIPYADLTVQAMSLGFNSKEPSNNSVGHADQRMESLCYVARCHLVQYEKNNNLELEKYIPQIEIIEAQESSPTNIEDAGRFEHPLDALAEESGQYHSTLPFLKGLGQSKKSNRDLYTPIYTRGKGKIKEGLCRICKDPSWFKIKISQYWYHSNITHGISSATGRPYNSPIEQKKISGKSFGRCHICSAWIQVVHNQKFSEGILWNKHVQKCHQS